MGVFRVHKESNFTTVLNDFIKDKRLSLKGRGLMITMLSLPDEWDYSERGLTALCKEGKDSIHSTLKELESLGYLVRRQLRDERGMMSDVEYNIYEKSILTSGQNVNYPDPDNPDTDNPDADNPDPACPDTENPHQLNTKEVTTKKSNTNSAKTIQSIPSAASGEGKGRDEMSRREEYEELIRENIAYDILAMEYPFDNDRLEELKDLIVDTVCTRRKMIRISSDDFPAEVVRSRFLKLTDEHIRYVLDSMKENTTAIRNMKQYLLAALYNAPMTIGNYYGSKVSHDMAE